MSGRDTSDAGAQPIRVEVLRGAPNEDELAAVVAVVSSAYAQEAASATVEEPPRTEAWARWQRGLRRPLDRSVRWGAFGR